MPPLFIVDAFTDAPFAGNPAAVVLLAGPSDDRWMQRVAAEMNLSETGFVYPEDDGYRLRWFTPLAEVALCGHATLATAHVLWEVGWRLPGLSINFHTLSGLLRATANPPWIELDFPALPAQPCEPPAGLAESLGAELTAVCSYRVDYLCEVKDEATLRMLEPDMSRLRELKTRGVVVTSRSDRPEYDFVSRFFAPAVGVSEDPVTGSAHCALAPYWAAKLGKETMVGYQASRRGGAVRVTLAADRVRLGGQAVTVVRGELTGY